MLDQLYFYSQLFFRLIANYKIQTGTKKYYEWTIPTNVNSIFLHSTDVELESSNFKALNVKRNIRPKKLKSYNTFKCNFSFDLFLFHYAAILTDFSSIFIVAVKDVGHVKMYGTNSKM
jgi:hypothetical protein